MASSSTAVRTMHLRIVIWRLAPESSESVPHADDLAQAAADMIGGIGRQPLNLDLDRQEIGVGLREDARRRQAARGQELERTRQHAGFGVGLETVSDGGRITLESEYGGHGTTPRMT